ncbi:DUF2201 family putative metallopeptidase [Thermus albus]|uniref:vWA domain-containing protein n=1 Tax=Thermus albus TaxID=2908146 RepID=UPI001FAAD78B|nr:VWA-like domain-containing protein [Thermus albus]
MERLRAARIALASKMPYLAPILFHIRFQETDRVPTMSIDNRGTLRYNPAFLETLTDPQVVGLLWHETHHLLREHTGPRGERLLEHPLGNIALDLEINDDAQEAGIDLPRPPHPYGGYFPENLGLPRGLLAEEYLEFLNPPPPPKPELQDISLNREGEDNGPQMAVLRMAVAQKAKEYEAQGRGTLPLGLRRWVEKLLNPQADWRSLLRQAVRKSLADYLAKRRPTYARPNRRSSAYSPVLIPGYYGLRPRVAVVLDTSGSMDEGKLAQALGEIRGILRQVREVHVLSVDAALHIARKVFSEKDIPLLGGGGTDMSLGVAEAEKLRPDLIIVLTDGQTPWPEGIRTPTLAIIIGEGPPPPPYIPHVRIR